MQRYAFHLTNFHFPAQLSSLAWTLLSCNLEDLKIKNGYETIDYNVCRIDGLCL